MILTRNYEEPPICEKEMLRYAGCKSLEDELLQLLRDCLDEVLPRLSYKVCYMELPLTIRDDICDFGCMKVQSKDLAKNLQGCDKGIVFGATIGVEIDRLIAKYGHVSPAKALMFQAIGAERIEALCDAFCHDVESKIDANKGEAVKLHPRFSPGYGDVPLEIQKDIFQILDASKQIGLSLNDSLLMSPSKSVTAFVGIESAETGGMSVERKADRNKCAACEKTDCQYRGI